MKVCSKCGEDKTSECFYKHVKGKEGLRAQCKVCEDAKNAPRTKEWVAKNKDKVRDQSLRRKFGITLEKYTELLASQGECCFICRRHYSLFKKALAVDHAHSASEWVPKGAIRGLLCDNCNRFVIGRNTDAVRYERAAVYLKQHTGLISPPVKRYKRKKTNG